jgi:hypothetical protein
MAGYIQQDGKVYIGSAAMAASILGSTANMLAELNGNVTFEATWEKAEARWRTRAVKDRVAYAVDATINVEQVEFKASNLAHLFSGASTGTMALYGTTASAFFWRISTSTAPSPKQFLFEFTRTDDDTVLQIYAPRAEPSNWPTPFAVDDFTLQDITFDLMASTNGKFIDFKHALSAGTYSPTFIKGSLNLETV